MQIESAVSHYTTPDMSRGARVAQDNKDNHQEQPTPLSNTGATRDESEFSVDALRRGEIAIQNLEAGGSPFNGARLAALLYSHHERS